MPKKTKHKHRAPLSLDELRARVQRAEREERHQQALDLAKQLHKEDPSPANRELLRRVYLARARQLRQAGYLRDAATVLSNALPYADTDTAWLQQVGEELAACGQARQALEVLGRVPGATGQGRILARAADEAMRQGPSGRGMLPESLRDPFDLVLQAFRLLEAGQDDQMREALQGIGLQSPFLEWKLLIRGLLAYYQNDDARAVENWQRLDADRLPARLAAPLRASIDPAYREAQPPEVQLKLRQQADRMQEMSLVQSLRAVQVALSNTEQLPRAFRLAEGVVPALRQQYPQLVPRLAACFFWAIVSGGEPEDVTRYNRVFGAPPDDRSLARLRALLAEQLHEMPEAHKHWQKYEQEIAANAAAWPGEQANRARALVWDRMGHNAANVPDLDALPDLPPFLRDHPDRPRPLTPSAEACFRRGLELAPDQLEAHESLFHYYVDRDEDAKAEKAGRQLLERFPEHVPTLEAMGDLCLHLQKYPAALDYFQRALQINPLDRRLRGRVGNAHLFNARQHAEDGRFDEARAEYQASLALQEGKEDGTAYCKWAACEFKAGNPQRAEELLQQALAVEGNRLNVAYSMLIETIRLKLPRALKTRFDREFKDALAEPPTAVAAAAVARNAAAHQRAGVTYHGQKTHEKKVLAYLAKAEKAQFTEDQLREVCSALVTLEAIKPLRTFARLGQKRFPRSPYFYFIEAEGYISQGPQRCPIYEAGSLLEKARELAEGLPPDEARRDLIELIQQRQAMIGALSPFGGMGMFEDILDMFGGGYDDDDDFEDEFDDGW